jgi:hypothetical protein
MGRRAISCCDTNVVDEDLSGHLDKRLGPSCDVVAMYGKHVVQVDGKGPLSAAKATSTTEGLKQ